MTWGKAHHTPTANMRSLLLLCKRYTSNAIWKCERPGLVALSSNPPLELCGGGGHDVCGAPLRC